jgi:ketosteroid isomerase-like protein
MTRTNANREFDKTLALVSDAVDGVYHSDAGPYAALLANRAQVSLFGALGPCERGKPAVVEALQRAAGRFADGSMTIAYEVVEVGTDFAYTVGFETGQVSIDGTPTTTRIRVTHVFRLEDGAWRLVHRHGDFAPTGSLTPPAPTGDSQPGATGYPTLGGSTC